MGTSTCGSCKNQHNALLIVEKGAIGIGIISSNYQGGVIAAKCERLQGFMESHQAKAIVVKEGLRLALDLELQSLIQEGDARTILESFNNSEEDLSYTGVILS